MGLENIGSSASGLVLLICKILAIIVFAVIIFMTTKTIRKTIKKRKVFKINAFISNPDGSHMMWKCGKFKDKDGLEKMLFMRKVKMLFGISSWSEIKGESLPVINPAHIVSNTVHLFRYGISQYSVIPPTVYRKTNLTKKFGIELINMNMLHWKGLEQRASISRWSALKDKMAKLTPLITIVVICVLAGVAVYFLTKYGMNQFNVVTAARTADCMKLIGGGSAPIETVKSIVAPLA